MRRTLGLMTAALMLTPALAFGLTNPNDSCAGFFLCAQTCGQADQACQQACAPTDADEMNTLVALNQCAQTNCAANPTPACIAASCTADYDACFGPWVGNPDGTCAGFQMCTQTCATPDQACAQSCAPSDQAELGLVSGLSQCLQTNCAAGATPQCLIANCLDEYAACLGQGGAPGSCGAVTADGECDGDTLRACVADQVEETDCAALGKECTETTHGPASCMAPVGPGEDVGGDEPDAGGSGQADAGPEVGKDVAGADGAGATDEDTSAAIGEDTSGGFAAGDSAGGTGGTGGTGGIGADSGSSGGCSSTTAPMAPAGAVLMLALMLLALRRRA